MSSALSRAVNGRSGAAVMTTVRWALRGGRGGGAPGQGGPGSRLRSSVSVITARSKFKCVCPAAIVWRGLRTSAAALRQAHSLKGGYQKADKAKGDTSVNDMLYTLPEQQNLMAYGESKLRIKFYGGKALGKQARATHMQSIPALAYDCNGYVVQSKTFSDVAATLLLEIPRARMPKFLDTLHTRGLEMDLKPTGLSRGKLDDLLGLGDAELADRGFGEAVGVVFRLEYPFATHEIRSEIGDLRKDMRPLGPVNLGGGAFPPEKRVEQKNHEVTMARHNAEERYAQTMIDVQAKRRAERKADG